MDDLNMKQILLKTYFGLSTLTLITIVVDLMVMNLSGKAKKIEMVIFTCSIKNIHFLSPMFLVLQHVDLHKKIISIGESDRDWVDVETIKSGTISATRIYVSEIQSIVYKYNCIESYIIGLTDYESNINDCHPRHVWNYDDEVFDNKLEKLGVENFVNDKPEYV